MGKIMVKIQTHATGRRSLFPEIPGVRTVWTPKEELVGSRIFPVTPSPFRWWFFCSLSPRRWTQMACHGTFHWVFPRPYVSIRMFLWFLGRLDSGEKLSGCWLLTAVTTILFTIRWKEFQTKQLRSFCVWSDWGKLPPKSFRALNQIKLALFAYICLDHLWFRYIELVRWGESKPNFGYY